MSESSVYQPSNEIEKLKEKVSSLTLENEQLKAYVEELETTMDGAKLGRYAIVSIQDALELYLMPDFKGKIYCIDLQNDICSIGDKDLWEIKQLLDDKDILVVLDYGDE